MDEQMSPDLLSDLPLETIHHILSFVPIREAIGTSELSRQWRYIWTSLPNLVFDRKCVNQQLMGNRTDINSLFKFISQVLVHHEGPIHKLELRFPSTSVSEAHFLCFIQKLLSLSLNGIRILVLHFVRFDPWIEMHSRLYSCQNLTRLELTVNTIPPPPPSFKGFLFLRRLIICAPNVDCSTIERIVALSPLLEELLLFGVQHLEMTIRAPNLKLLHFNNESTHLSLCTPLLEELILYSEYIKHLSFHEFSAFHHLRSMDLCGMHFRNRAEVIMVVNRLITCSPNLQKLDISTDPPDAPEIAPASDWDIESAPDITYDNVKVIKMSFLGCGINEMKLVKLLLARSPALERMICQPRSPLSEQVLLNLEAELLSCPRASANAEIVIDKSEQEQDA